MIELMKKSIWILATMAVVFALGTMAFGQCSMCRATLAGSNSAFIRNFNIGVLVLLVPPVTIFCSIFVVLRRYKSSEAPESPASRQELKDKED